MLAMVLPLCLTTQSISLWRNEGEKPEGWEHRWEHRTEAKENTCDVTNVTAGSADSDTAKGWDSVADCLPLMHSDRGG